MNEEKIYRPKIIRVKLIDLQGDRLVFALPDRYLIVHSNDIDLDYYKVGKEYEIQDEAVIYEKQQRHSN